MTNEQLISKQTLNVELDKMDELIEHEHDLAGIEFEKINERLDALEIQINDHDKEFNSQDVTIDAVGKSSVKNLRQIRKIWDAIKVLTNKYHRL